MKSCRKWFLCVLCFVWVILVYLINRGIIVKNYQCQMKKFHKFVPYYGVMHVNCRNGYYPKTNNTVQRQHVPDDSVCWDKDWPEYSPPVYTAKHIGGQPWADSDLTEVKFHPKWNSLDGPIDRTSYMGEYKVVDNFPLNPVGRTGLKGRGLLGKWGPNHAADPIVTKWKRDPISGDIVIADNGKPIVQFVGIKRRDSGHWAIPGGMVDSGENPMETLKREFTEEALDFLQKNNIEKEHCKDKIDRTFLNGEVVYQGYVDDPRNTDNAWIETIAVHFHDNTGTDVGALPLTAGDDAADASWIDIDSKLNLYASHSTFFKEITNRLNAYW